MNIMFYLGSMYKGGAERVVSNLSNYLIEKNHISIIVHKIDRLFYKINDNVNIESLNSNKYANRYIRHFNLCHNLLRIIKNNKPNVIICFLNGPSLMTLFLKKFHFINKNIRVIISVRNDPKKLYGNFIKKIIMGFFFKSADGFVFQTKEAQDFFNSKITCKSVIIPNPINEAFINERYRGTREKIIVSVGRLVEQKNHKLLIDAFYDLQKEYDDYTLKIFGDGNLKDKLIKYCNDLKIIDKVYFMGNVDNIKDEIRKASMFVLSSNYEGMPNALMEAMALGIPCISSDCPCGGPKFLIKNNYNGLLFPVNNKNKLVAGMKKILSNTDFSTKLGENATNISKILSPTIINKKWEHYIVSVIGSDNNVSI